MYALIESNESSFSDGRVIGCLIASAVLLVVFIVVEQRMRQPMFDLGLFRLPTFSGAAVAAFGLSASIFSMLLYLVLYLQDVLGFSAFDTGLRLLVISGGIVLTTPIAGRLSARVPVRLLIGPGLMLVGVGLLLMRGLNADSSWTHLIPGLIISGAGVGMVNPPLASTAVGVVRPDRAGMASGINSTFRQVGIATGIALLGTLFSNKVTSDVIEQTRRVPALAGRGQQLANAVQSGDSQQAVSQIPPSGRAAVEQIVSGAHSPPVSIGSCSCRPSSRSRPGVVAFATLRSKDFASRRQP